MDRLADFDGFSLDSPMILKLEVLGKLARLQMDSLERGSTVILPEKSDQYFSSSLFERAAWGPLDDLSLHFQRDGWAYYGRFRSLGSFVMALDVPSRRDRFRFLARSISAVLAQNNHAPGVLPSEARMEDFEEARRALPEQFRLLEEASDKKLGMPVFVPDTNVLMDIATPATNGVRASLDWERLAAGHRESLAVVLLPVVKELDELKRSRDDRRKALAQAAISVLWDIRSTGRGHKGWEVARDRYLDFLTTEPTSQEMEFLSWLDSERPDHRIVASALDVARRFLGDQVAVVTGDLNMTLLAGFAALRALKIGEPMPSDEP